MREHFADALSVRLYILRIQPTFRSSFRPNPLMVLIVTSRANSLVQVNTFCGSLIPVSVA